MQRQQYICRDKKEEKESAEGTLLSAGPGKETDSKGFLVGPFLFFRSVFLSPDIQSYFG